MGFNSEFKGLNAELNPICYMLALLGAHHILHVSRMRVNLIRWGEGEQGVPLSRAAELKELKECKVQTTG